MDKQNSQQYETSGLKTPGIQKSNYGLRLSPVSLNLSSHLNERGIMPLRFQVAHISFSASQNYSLGYFTGEPIFPIESCDWQLKVFIFSIVWFILMELEERIFMVLFILVTVTKTPGIEIFAALTIVSCIWADFFLVA